MRRRTRPAALAVLAGLALAAGPAAGVQRVVHDRQGRPITFDVQAPDVDVASYARVLRNAVHGDEIRDVTIRIVPASRVGRACGAEDADGCYGGDPPRITLPAGTGPEVEHVLLHEYGHHVDRTHPHGGLEEPNGTRRWWAARRMAARLRAGEVATDYSRGWSHAIGEIFAEDYVQLHVLGGDAIGWLRPPTEGVLRALRVDLTGRPTGPAPRAAAPPIAPDPPPTLPDGTPGLRVDRSGELRPGERRVLPFGLLGPGRRVTLEVTLRGLADGPPVARAEIACDGAVIAREQGAGPLTIDLPGQGPASCEASVAMLRGTAAYRVVLTLRREDAPPPG